MQMDVALKPLLTLVLCHLFLFETGSYHVASTNKQANKMPQFVGASACNEIVVVSARLLQSRKAYCAARLLLALRLWMLWHSPPPTLVVWRSPAAQAAVEPHTLHRSWMIWMGLAHRATLLDESGLLQIAGATQSELRRQTKSLRRNWTTTRLRLHPQKLAQILGPLHFQSHIEGVQPAAQAHVEDGAVPEVLLSMVGACWLTMPTWPCCPRLDGMHHHVSVYTLPPNTIGCFRVLPRIRTQQPTSQPLIWRNSDPPNRYQAPDSNS